MGLAKAQVKQLLAKARRDSEAKVKAELKVMHDKIAEMDAALDLMMDQLGDEAVEQHTVAQALAKVEQQWGRELGKLKQELHQTVFAHNHNADLMKHQKDSIDELRAKLETKPPIAQMEAKAQAKVEALHKMQESQRLEPLFTRLLVIEQRLAMNWPRRWG